MIALHQQDIAKAATVLANLDCCVYLLNMCLISPASHLSHFVGLDEFITHIFGHSEGLILHPCLYPIW